MFLTLDQLYLPIRIPTTFDSISSLISIDANFVYILVVKSGLSNAFVDDLCFLKGYFD
jgi:hypothetical protein